MKKNSSKKLLLLATSLLLLPSHGNASNKERDEAFKMSLPVIKESYLKGDDRACSNLGVFYATGDNVKKDMGEAIKWYTMACDLKVGDRCNRAGFILWKGVDGVKKDLEKAKKLFKEGCTLKDPDACANLLILLK